MDATGMHISQLAPEEALTALSSGPDGLDAREAARRLAEFGPNRVEAAPRKLLWLTFLGEFSHFFAIVLWLAAALGLGVVFFCIGHAIGLPFWANFMFAIGILVANVPEGLLPTVTLALAMATQRMARRNALVRHLPAVETPGSATVILTDKTGTLTQNRMTVRELYFSGRHRPATTRWPRGADMHLRAVARYCHALKFPDGQPCGDPMEIALWQFAGETPAFGEWAGEIPFDAERKRMSVLTLGAERPHADVMRRPPRPRSERLLSWPLLSRAYLFLGPLEALAAMAMFFLVLGRGGWQYGEMLPVADPLYLQATTACLMAIVLTQVANLLVCRHPVLPAWRFPLQENRLLLAGLAVELGLLLAIVYTPWGNELFGTAPLSADVWMMAVPFALLLLLAEEIRKGLVRSWGKTAT